jgi:hypothetical protein
MREDVCGAAAEVISEDGNEQKAMEKRRNSSFLIGRRKIKRCGSGDEAV